MARLPYDDPIQAAAEHGEVVLDGPEGLATSLTPAAARTSARHIKRAADIAANDPDAESPMHSSYPEAED